MFKVKRDNMKAEIGMYCYSYDGEGFVGEFNTISELLEETGVCDRLVIGRIKCFIGWRVDPDTITEILTENLYDDVGEVAEGYQLDQSIIEKHIGAMLDELGDPGCYQVETIDAEEIKTLLELELKGASTQNTQTS